VTPAGARLLAACGALAPVIFTATWVVAGFVQDGYSARREDISGLAARSAEYPWLMMAGLLTTGLLVAAFALALHHGVRRGSVAGPALVALCGLGIVALGLLRNDCSSLTEECESRVEAGEVSWQHTAHDLVSVPVFAAAIAAPLVLALRFRRIRAGAPSRRSPLRQRPCSAPSSRSAASRRRRRGTASFSGWRSPQSSSGSRSRPSISSG
jgi:Protein of unknown function (DUF998)